jgi:phospholipid transport system substrate-binding protein
MMTRRLLLATGAAFVLLPRVLRAAPADAAGSFVDKMLHDLVAIVNGPDSTDAKKAALTQIVDRDVDIAGVAQFCLGRFWRTATPDEQRDYTGLFHAVLLRNITGNIGEYKGVTFTVGRTSPRDGATVVETVVSRPGNEPNQVNWLMDMSGASPKIIDVIAEGTSLRLTQRQDYGAFLSHNNNSVPALIAAMRKQTG